MSTHYVSGNLALGYVGTLNERWTTRLENLHDRADVANWFVGAGVLDEQPLTDSDTLPEALALREALFLVVKHLIDTPAEELPHTALDVINKAATHPPPILTVQSDGRRHRDGTWRSGLSAVARDGIALIDLGDAELKWCADPACTHPFLDRSHGHRRRWCGMSGCGDRAKAKAYRARRRTPH